MESNAEHPLSQRSSRKSSLGAELPIMITEITDANVKYQQKDTTKTLMSDLTEKENMSTPESSDTSSNKIQEYSESVNQSVHSEQNSLYAAQLNLAEPISNENCLQSTMYAESPTQIPNDPPEKQTDLNSESPVNEFQNTSSSRTSHQTNKEEFLENEISSLETQQTESLCQISPTEFQSQGRKSNADFKSEILKNGSPSATSRQGSGQLIETIINVSDDSQPSRPGSRNSKPPSQQSGRSDPFETPLNSNRDIASEKIMKAPSSRPQSNKSKNSVDYSQEQITNVTEHQLIYNLKSPILDADVSVKEMSLSPLTDELNQINTTLNINNETHSQTVNYITAPTPVEQDEQILRIEERKDSAISSTSTSPEIVEKNVENQTPVQELIGVT